VLRRNDHDLRAVTLALMAPLPHEEGRDFRRSHHGVAEIARELDAAAPRPASVRRRPRLGGQAGAENGVLTVMCGGAEDAYAAPNGIALCGCASASDGRLGTAHQDGQPDCIAGLFQGLSEGIHFGEEVRASTWPP